MSGLVPILQHDYSEVPQPDIVSDCRRCFPADRIRGRYCLVSPTGVAHVSEDSPNADRTFCGHDATGDGWWWPL